MSGTFPYNDTAAGSAAMGHNIPGQMDSFSVLHLLKLIFGAIMMPAAKEQLLDLNTKLNTIPVK